MHKMYLLPQNFVCVSIARLHMQIYRSVGIQNVRLTFHGRTGDVRDAFLVLKEWITEELQLLYLSFSASLENVPNTSRLNKNACMMQ